MELLTIENFLSLFTLLGLEIILGIDNLIFISISCSGLYNKEKKKARNIGIISATILRICMLLIAIFLKSFSTPLFVIFTIPISIKSIFYLLGGGFLLIKGVNELYFIKKNIDFAHNFRVKSDFRDVLIQMSIINAIFSFDSMMVAISITETFLLMFSSVFITLFAMLFFSRRISHIINRYKSIKILAFAIVSLLGISLIFSGLNMEISKSSLYLTIFFAISFEIIRTIVIDNNKLNSQSS